MARSRVPVDPIDPRAPGAPGAPDASMHAPRRRAALGLGVGLSLAGVGGVTAAAPVAPAAVGAVAAPVAAAPTTAARWSPVRLPAARQIDLHDAATGRPYRLFLSQPEGPPPPGGHPVLYVLDGNAAFPVAAFLARGFASRRERTGQPPVQVVGIGYPGEADFDVQARLRDYTPSPGALPGGAREGGEADRFLDFIERQVQPLVAREQAVDVGRQALFGHSLGGLLVLHALATRPQAFSTWLASSPSLWWDGYRLLRQPLPAAPAAADRSRLQISVGALEDAPPTGPLTPELRALLDQRKMVAPARELVRRLRAEPGWADRVSFHELADEDHGPAWLPALSRGFRRLLAEA
ncbi:alpha/beta hydrolase [Pseudaquabacterium rugosum]|uniref:Acyl-CoA:diacylglycerol acyltransferase n=1 Tax=Pseudaquabacterium rugosum TaxID=2984194 RepID=A0ABU9BH20_9BURK